MSSEIFAFWLAPPPTYTFISATVLNPARSVKRSTSASPATGSAKAHKLEQKTLLTLAFTAV